MTENFIPLIDSSVGRIVTLGSGAGPMFAKNQTKDIYKIFG
jgi:hypothetical protein